MRSVYALKFIVVNTLQVVVLATSSVFDNSVDARRWDISFRQQKETGTFVEVDLFDSLT
jgi:hypothetical protein